MHCFLKFTALYGHSAVARRMFHTLHTYMSLLGCTFCVCELRLDFNQPTNQPTNLSIIYQSVIAHKNEYMLMLRNTM